MAGIAYIYQGNAVSFDDERYIDPEFGTAKFLMNMGSATHYHGFTTDVTASEYCPLFFNVGETKARIGSSASRSKAYTDDEHEETWSGTGYISTTTTTEVTHPAGTYYTGAVTSQTSEYRYTTYFNQRSMSYAHRSEWEYPVETVTTLSATPTSFTLQTNTFQTRSFSQQYGYPARYMTFGQSETQHSNSNSTYSSRDWLRVTSSWKSASYGTAQQQVGASTSSTSSCKLYTFGEMVETVMPQWYETLTITKEILHNINL